MATHQTNDRKAMIWSIVLWGVIALGVGYVLLILIGMISMAGMMLNSHG